MTDKRLNKMIHGFLGLEETVSVTHRDVTFSITFSRRSRRPDAPIESAVGGSDRITATICGDDRAWTIVAHGSEVMFYRTSYSERIGRAEIIFSADRSWRFQWKTHTVSGVPESRVRN